MQFSFFLFFLILLKKFHLILNFKNEISFNLKKDSFSENENIFVSGYNKSYIYLKCKTNLGFIEKLKPSLSILNNGVIFQMNFTKYPTCKILNIGKLNVNESNNQIIFHYKEISYIQKNTYIRENLIKSKINLEDYYLKSSNSHFNLHYIKELRGNYIY